MGTFANIDCLCRLCGDESQDLIYLFGNSTADRDLVALIKKYINIVVTIKDILPHQVCGPCLAKLDEVILFVDATVAAQHKLKEIVKGNDSSSSKQDSEDHFCKIIRGVKVELEEGEGHIGDYDSDSDEYAEKLPSKKRKFDADANDDPKPEPGAPNLDEGDLVISEDSNEPTSKPKKAANVKSKKKAPTTSAARKARRKGTKPVKKVRVKKEAEVKEKPERKSKYSVRCPTCEEIINGADMLKKHVNEVHQLTDIQYMCLQCPQVYKTYNAVTCHLRKIHKSNFERCLECKKIYPSHYISRHKLTHATTRPFGCDQCEKKFKSNENLLAHKRKHRPSEERYKHCCEVCGKRFTQKANLDGHMRSHTGDRPFKCEFCGKGFSQKINMEEHRRSHTGERPFVCELCGVSYSRQSQYIIHRRRHSGEKNHKCRYCEKTFYLRRNAREHERVHTDDRPYKCNYCEKTFRFSSPWKVHERLHTGERPYECQYCEQSFYDTGNFSKHLLRIHKVSKTSTGPPQNVVTGARNAKGQQDQDPSEDRPYQCQFCSHSFYQSNALAKHLRLHQRGPKKDQGQSSLAQAQGAPSLQSPEMSQQRPKEENPMHHMAQAAAAAYHMENSMMQQRLKEREHLLPQGSHPLENPMMLQRPKEREQQMAMPQVPYMHRNPSDPPPFYLLPSSCPTGGMPTDNRNYDPFGKMKLPNAFH